MRIESIQIGKVETLQYGDAEIVTGGNKKPIPTAKILADHLEGDEQADHKNHGGSDKAICVYSHDHYAYWAQTLNTPLEPGAFSENLTISGVHEKEVCLGDIFEINKVRVQISQPRQPCTKLAGKRNLKNLGELIHVNSFSGFYFRVLHQGQIKTGDAVKLLLRHPLGVTVEFANQVMYKHRTDRASIERVLAVDALSHSWLASLHKRLKA